MRDLVLLAFIAAVMAMGFRRPFLWVLLYIYVDIVAPQKVAWGLLTQLSISLVVFVMAFAGYFLLDSKKGSRLSARQGLVLLFLVWCGLTTLWADYQDTAWLKWDWVWKGLVFAAFLPLTLRTRLRIEAAALVMVLSAATIIIPAGIKTVFSGGGGYGALSSLVAENTGLYEGSTLSTVAVAMIPLVVWVARFSTIITERRLAMTFAVALCFAALLVPVGTQTRTGLVCVAVLGVLSMRSARHKVLYAGLAGAVLLAAIPFLPASYTERMGTIVDHQSDQSASTRVAVWEWTWNYAKANPLGGGFDAYRGNSFTYQTRQVEEVGGTQEVTYQEVTEESRAYHSAYFEVLGEQGYVGLFIWFAIHLSGLWQMERVRRRYALREDDESRRWRSLATALQHGHVVYLVGAAFIGVGYQPFIFMMVGLEIAVNAVVRRERGVERAKPWLREAEAKVATT
ncbi:putative O-glycosylation ligase, exosortase A system-associated [Erythrobacter arachoides]|uniref:Putative O-glycosylation ligase, exosortase A system-associated n=1 Tax=Aurantiacibacter arachoides TaxID=1850444 RepID=A0A844ZXT1_9SPHN|nr:putative O-glycosylation ligase, exosortase A system-associated [Aurantiacibacter arachoides]MXO92000.1 putative O-glycosylation ligase, exosortase A system-associated [Aurantiacibacter arachoides]GGD60531.1 O-antigen polymerase [Aurantiacibacter arachoides]